MMERSPGWQECEQGPKTKGGKSHWRGERNRSQGLRENWNGRSSYGSDTLERRLLLAAVMAPADPVVYSNTVSFPLAPRAGHTFYVASFNSQGGQLSSYANASAITPNTVNDLVMNVTPFATNYVACCQGSGGSLGANLLTNGITQSQTAPAPSAGQPAVGDGGASDDSNNLNVVSEATGGTQYFFSYNLGTAGGAAPAANGYDLTELDVIAGHQAFRAGVWLVDVLVEPVGSSQFLSLSGGQGYTLTSVPNGQGGVVEINGGSAQFAIVSAVPGQPIAQNIQAVKLVVLDGSTFFREFAVTGTPSASAPTVPTVPSGVSASFAVPAVDISWNPVPAAAGYTVLRSAMVNGTYTAIGSVVGQTSFTDNTVQPNSAFFYEVTASGKGDSAASAPSAAVSTTNFGASGYFFSSQSWQGSLAISEIVPQINYSGGDDASVFPLKSGFNASSFSAIIEGKVTTDLAGPYTFYASTDDDGYLWVAGQLVSGNPGGHSLQQSPVTTIPINLAANTSYDFVFLENQRGGQWGMNMSWQEPTGIGTPGPLTVVPASHLSPMVDAPPVPQQVSASVLSATSVQVSWNSTGDMSSYGYVIERAPSNANGNPTGSFSVAGQVFSGPTPAGVSPSLTWGASSFVDTTAAPNSTYVYEVGAVLPGQAPPSTFAAPTRAVTTPPTVTAWMSSGTLNISLGAAGDAALIEIDASSNIDISESGNAIFSVPESSVNSLLVTGIGAGTQTLKIFGDLAVAGPMTVSGISDLTVEGAIFSGQLTVAVSDDVTFDDLVDITGPINVSADSDNNGSGELFVDGTVESGGNPISFHGDQIVLELQVDAGSGDIKYSLSPNGSASALLENSITSGTATVSQDNSTSVSFSGVANSNLTGNVVLNFPLEVLLTTGLDTSAGNAGLKINSAALAANGAINTGTAPLTLNAVNATILAGINAGAVTIPAGDSVALNGGTLTAQSLTNAGSFTVATGAAASIAGAVTGGGAVSVGTPAGSGTVAYYRFEGTAGTAATGIGSILDSSGNGLNATPENGPTYSSSVPAAMVPGTGAADTTSMSFNGTNQGVVIPDGPAFQLTHSLTLEAYVYAESLAGGDGNIIFRGDNQGGLDPYWLRYEKSTNSLMFQITNAANQTASISGSIPANQWVHVAATLDDSTGEMCLYVNGALVASAVTSIRPYAALVGGQPGLGIGSLQSGGEFFHGLIDEVRISNVALSPSQLLDAAQSPLGMITVGSINQSAITVSPTGLLTVAHNSSPTTSQTNNLSIATTGGKLDLSNNAMTINYTGQSDPIASIRSYLASGYSNGAWSGSGIVSSAAAANPNHNTAIGYADWADGQGVNTMPNTIELKYTLYGDANLDGQVNSADLQILLAGLNRSGSWDQGDFNYDGQVNSADLQALLFTLNTSLGSQAMPVGVAAVAAGAGATAPVAAVSHSPVRQGIPTSSITPAAPLTHHPRPAKPHAKRR